MFGLTVEKLLLIGVIAVFLVGPQRLPLYAAKLGAFVRAMRDVADTAKARVAEELGPDFDATEWQKLDPRQYDPRRIVRDALTEGASSDSTADALTGGATVRPRGVATGGWQEALLARAPAAPNPTGAPAPDVSDRRQSQAIPSPSRSRS